MFGFEITIRSGQFTANRAHDLRDRPGAISLLIDACSPPPGTARLTCRLPRHRHRVGPPRNWPTTPSSNRSGERRSLTAAPWRQKRGGGN